MSVIKIIGPNPDDGTTTFDQIEFGEADDANGTNASVIKTSSIDTSSLDLFFSGNTSYTYNTGSTSKYYATRWKISSSGVYTDWSTWIKGGEDRWDDMFKKELRDTGENVWSATDREYFKNKALQALWPEFFRDVVDQSLTIADSTLQYTVPNGIFHISEILVGDINKTTLNKIHNDNWRLDKNLLRFESISSFSVGDQIHLIASKRFMEVSDVDSRLDPLVMLKMRSDAYLWLADDFPRFQTWAKLQKGTKVSFENLRVHAREFERKFKEGKAELAKTLPAGVA